MDTIPCAQYLSVVPLSTPSSLVAADIVHNRAFIAHCQRISQSNRPPHHAHPLTSQQGFTRRRPYSLALALAHDDQVSPSPKFLATFGPCTLPLRRGLALIFTTLVLLAEDGPTVSKVLGGQQSQLPTMVHRKGARMDHAFALELLRR